MGLTPMMQQYLEIHEKAKNAILFFRLGDFYEMFFDDALLASKVLELTLTGRECGLEDRAPMCGVPYHSAENYITTLVEKGYKVAICEQVEDPATAQGLVKREIIRIISPGTVSEGKLLKEGKNNYLMALYEETHKIGMAYVDISTGDFYVTDFEHTNGNNQSLFDEVGRIKPAEILVNPVLFKNTGLIKQLEERFHVMTNLFPGKYFQEKASATRIKKQFKVFALGALGLENQEHCIRATGALLRYIDETQKRALSHINTLNTYHNNAYMMLDLSSRRNLELTETLRSGEKRGSLLWVLDQTVTAMGSRMLRRMIEAPLLKKAEIITRQDQIEELFRRPGTLDELKKILSKVYDMERLCGRISFGTCTPKDLLALKQSIAILPELKTYFENIEATTLFEKYGDADMLVDVFTLIEQTLDDNAPMALKDGHVIKKGFSKEIDEYREASDHGKEWLKTLEQTEKERTGIKKLRIKYNKVFGYFIEITNSYLGSVPDNYIRKQTLTNAERFFTPELKEMENKILGAEESLARLEYMAFATLREKITAEMPRIQKRAKHLAMVDALYALAQVALKNNYIRPEIREDGILMIENGRHPVVEALIGENNFIANDTAFDGENLKMMLITGPNMAGKSTYIRQTAIITLMAQVGSFVPAQSARIGIVDRIFTRVGASDDLVSGQSTFMVEMTEVSNILNNATENALVILDEIGRGTSTFDGISIAWAVVEALYERGVKTLFATHYHELIELEQLKTGIKNYSIRLKETPNGVVFLRKINLGPADRSYGIEVAELAGFPKAVIERSREILALLDEDETTYRKELLETRQQAVKESQMSFIQVEPTMTKAEEEALVALRSLSLNELTPIQALNKLYQLQKKISGR